MNMEKKEYIEELIRKYREATATEAEEQELKGLLRGGYAADFPDEADILWQWMRQRQICSILPDWMLSSTILLGL